MTVKGRQTLPPSAGGCSVRPWPCIRRCFCDRADSARCLNCVYRILRPTRTIIFPGHVLRFFALLKPPTSALLPWTRYAANMSSSTTGDIPHSQSSLGSLTYRMLQASRE